MALMNLNSPLFQMGMGILANNTGNYGAFGPAVGRGVQQGLNQYQQALQLAQRRKLMELQQQQAERAIAQKKKEEEVSKRLMTRSEFEQDLMPGEQPIPGLQMLSPVEKDPVGATRQFYGETGNFKGLENSLYKQAQMENLSGKKPSVGIDREAYAQSMFGAKFHDLSQNQQKAINKLVAKQKAAGDKYTLADMKRDTINTLTSDIKNPKERAEKRLELLQNLSPIERMMKNMIGDAPTPPSSSDTYSMKDASGKEHDVSWEAIVSTAKARGKTEKEVMEDLGIVKK